MTAMHLAPDPAAAPPETPLVPPGESGRGRLWSAAYGSRRILGMRVDATTYQETAAAVVAWASSGEGGAVSVATVHMVMEAFDDPAYRDLVNASDRVTPDGVPLVWGLRALGLRRARRVYGPTLMPEVCGLAEARGLPIGLFGGAPDVLAALVERLGARFPKLEISYAHSPPFRPLFAAEDAAVVSDIAASGARILFVGLGCPKQERWIAAHRDALPCVMLGVGAAFDYLAERRPQAPPWLQRAGLEWLFRLAAEPRRLWHRYLVHNPRFVFHFGRELARVLASGLRR